MSDKYEKLNDTFDVEASEVSKEIVEKKIDKIESSVEDIKKAIDPRLSPLALGVVLVGGYFLFKRVTR